MNIAVSQPFPHTAFTAIPSPRRARMLLSLMAADSAALALAVGITVLAKAGFTGELEFASHLRLAVFLPVFLAAYGAAGLYSRLSLGPPEEARRSIACSSLMFVFLSAVTVSMRSATAYLRPTLFIAAGLAAALVPLLRSAIRGWLGDRPWWGYPAVIFGPSKSAADVVAVMRTNPGQGLKPIAIVNGEARGMERVEGLPLLSSRQILEESELHQDTYAVLAPNAGPRTQAELESCKDRFARIIAISASFPGIANLWAMPHAMGGLLGIEVCQQALLPNKHLLKRIWDFVLALLSAPVTLPLIAAIAVWIKLDSAGPAFFRQERIGRGGRTFGAWKFRSMVANAAGILERELKRDPSLRLEWEQTQKLKHDPRITRAGAFLRKSSLDELPQLWNVLKGEMSLVGPRPIVQAEIARYGAHFAAYAQVPGGITGLWQVSGRNDTSYEERVGLDAYYVRNWSVWLDLYILFRTVGTVLFRKGAY
jgi:Undecaprenyl-phosphate galactose phosphotransferase WbaP